MENSIRHLDDSEKVTFGELLLKARRNEDEEMLVKVTSKSSVMESEVKGDLEEKVDKLLTVAKSGQMGNGKGKRDRSTTPKLTSTNSRQGTPTKRDNEQDIRNSLQGPGVNALGPFENGQKPIQCFKCKGWGHPRRLCLSRLNYMRGGMAMEPPSPTREEMRQSPPSNSNTHQ